jgi:hypothetical protein
MSLLTRVQRAVSAFNRQPINMKEASARLDAMIQAGELETEEKASIPRSSRLDIRNTDHDLQYVQTFNSLRGWVKDLDKKLNKIPRRDDPSRDFVMAEYWKEEPILAGAVYSMTAKMESLGWVVTGPRRPALQAAKLLSRAAHMGGYDWGGCIASVAQDFYTLNRGVFLETAKDGDPLYSPMIDLGHIDGLNCTLTGNSKYPMVYSSDQSGQILRFQPGEYIHYASMTSPREHDLGGGYCFVDRALKAAKLLFGLHDYDLEKLNNLPPEGVAAVTGLTMDEFSDAINLWKVARQRDNSLTFPQVLWLIGSQPNAEVKVGFTGFSQLPESFNRKEVVEQYVCTLALDAGVDVREFWSLTGGGLGATAGESEIQHLKAKGKGPGEFISTTERKINGELPPVVDFRFDTQDIEEDANAAAIAKAWVDAFFPLYNLPPKEAGAKEAAVSKANPRPDKPNGAPTLPTPMLPKADTGGAMGINEGGQKSQAEQVIDKEQFLRILADKGVIPDWMVNDERIAVTDVATHNYWFKSEGDDFDTAKFVWDKGMLKEVRPNPIVITSPLVNVPTAEIAKEETTIADTLLELKAQANQLVEQERKISGTAIPEQEVSRGFKVNNRVIHDELERWRAHPILSKYAITPEEEKALMETLR